MASSDRLSVRASSKSGAIALAGVTTCGGILGQATVDELRERAGRVGRDVAHPWRRFDDVRDEHGRSTLAVEGQAARECAEGDDAERVLIAAAIHRLAAHLLGAHVVHRAEHLAGGSERLRFGDTGDAEVGDHSAAGRALDEDVLRLHVPMDDAVRVRVIERRGDVAQQRHELARRQRAAGRQSIVRGTRRPRAP